MLHASTLSHFSRVQLSVALWTAACQGRVSTGFSRKEYWIGLPFPSPGHLPDPGIEPLSPCTFCTGRQILYPLSHWGSPDATLLLLLSCSVMSDSFRPRGLQQARLPCLAICWSLLKLRPIESVIPDNHLILCHPFLLHYAA